MSRRERQELKIFSGGDLNENLMDDQSPKAQKKRRISRSGSTDNSEATETVSKGVENSIVVDQEQVRPKSRKELRTEKKQAAKKAAASVDASNKPTPTVMLSEEEQKMERIRLKKERRMETLKERKQQERLNYKEIRQEKKLRKVKKRNREINAPGGSGAKKGKTELQKIERKQDQEKTKKSQKPEAMDSHVFNDLFNGTHNDTTGATTLRLGVKYIDLVVGNGPVAQDRTLVTVKYKLTGGKFGATIDSSKKFNFRLGKGEVIQGWDIGVAGMREGGRRQLIVPPKAGYGSQDIGAGSGATLFFDVTLLECRA